VRSSTKIGRAAIAVVVAAVVAAAVGCHRGGGDEPVVAPRLVLAYVPCTVNRDYLAPYNPAVAFTPALRAFAAESVVFERHVTETGMSGPAYASIFSGTQADTHGVYRHPGRLADDLTLIAEHYRAAGYDTFYWNGHPAAGSRLNYAQGVPAGNVVGKELLAADERFGRILERLRDDPGYRAFVLVNTTVSHGPYRTGYLGRFLEHHREAARGLLPSEISRYSAAYSRNHFGLSWSFPTFAGRLAGGPGETRKLAAVVELLYRSGIREMDARFGAIVDRIGEVGLLDDSLIVFTADHGELLYREHAPFKWNHMMLLAADVLTVPLLVRSPALEAGSYSSVTRSIDLLPTMLTLSGLEAGQTSWSGTDLAPALLGRTPAPRLLGLSHSAVLSRAVVGNMNEPAKAEEWTLLRARYPADEPRYIAVAIRDGDMVYRLERVAAAAEESTDGERSAPGDWRVRAFDLAVDAGEASDVYDADRGDHREMAGRLARYKQRLEARFAEADAAPGRHLLPAREQQMLRELGYIR